MVFTFPYFITQSLIDKDTLTVDFMAPNLFVDEEDGQVLADGTKVKIELPP